MISCRATYIDITPKSPISLSGYSGGPRIPKEIASKLETNIFLLKQGCQRIVLMQLDYLFPSLELKPAILGLLDKLASLMIVTSYTRFAPPLDPGKPALRHMDGEYFDEIVSRLAEAERAGLGN